MNLGTLKTITGRRPRPMATPVDRRKTRPVPVFHRLRDETLNDLVNVLSAAGFLFVFIWALDAVEKVGQL